MLVAQLIVLNQYSRQFWSRGVLVGPTDAPVVEVGNSAGAHYLFPSHRIQISEHLLTCASSETLVAIVAHEVGHAVHRRQYLWLSLFAAIAAFLTMLLGLFLLDAHCRDMPMNSITAICLTIPTIGLCVALHRNRCLDGLAAELQADSYAAFCVGSPLQVRNALIEVIALEEGEQGLICGAVAVRIAALMRKQQAR